MNVTVKDVPFKTATKEIEWKTFLKNFLAYTQDMQDKEAVKTAQKEDTGEEISLDVYRKMCNV